MPIWHQTLTELREGRKEAIRNLEAVRNSTVFVLWSVDSLRTDDFFTLADMLDRLTPDTPKRPRNVDLVVQSPGGSGEAGYRIGHTFQQWAARHGWRFRVLVPRYAMSAATILALGAHELAMGLASQIGPIDPQFLRTDPQTGVTRRVPGMVLFDGLKLIAEYQEQIPSMSEFFERILNDERISLEELGILERYRESGKQYGFELLTRGMIADEEVARATVERLADFYKVHGHPIDAYEAEKTLKLNVHHMTPAESEAARRLGEVYERFVGESDIVPGVVAMSVIETATQRSWRLVPTEPGHSSRVAALPPAGPHGDVTTDG